MPDCLSRTSALLRSLIIILLNRTHEKKLLLISSTFFFSWRHFDRIRPSWLIIWKFTSKTGKWCSYNYLWNWRMTSANVHLYVLTRWLRSIINKYCFSRKSRDLQINIKCKSFNSQRNRRTKRQTLTVYDPQSSTSSSSSSSSTTVFLNFVGATELLKFCTCIRRTIHKNVTFWTQNISGSVIVISPHSTNLTMHTI